MLAEAYHHPDSALGKALARFTDTGSEFTFNELISSLMQQRTASMSAVPNITALFAAAGFAADTMPETLSARYFDRGESSLTKMRRIAALVAEKGTANDKKYTAALQPFLEGPYAHERATAWRSVC